MNPVVPVDVIRQHFPALQRHEHGAPVAYFDGPGGTQVPTMVIDAMTDYLLHHNANTHWHYPTSAETDDALLDARAVLGTFVGGDRDEIAFGNNMTTLTFHVARALARDWQAGDEIIVTELDHHANVAPWHAVARDFGLVLKWLPLDVESGALQLDRLPSLLTSRTRLLAIGAASNLLGQVTDVTSAARMARDAGALTFVDGVHYAPHFLPAVHQLECDLFACSAYKFHGPHVGVLWGRRDLLERLDVPRLAPAPDTAPERLETGTQNHEGIVGAAAAVRWLASLAGDGPELRAQLEATYRALHDRETRQFARLWQGLGDIDGVVRYGPPPGPRRTPTVAFTMRGRRPAEIAGELSRAACFVSDGDFYASTAVERLGRQPDGVVRIGIACYTSDAEVERVLSALAAIVP